MFPSFHIAGLYNSYENGTAFLRHTSVFQPSLPFFIVFSHVHKALRDNL
jgi:hypothetical protein